MITRTTCVFGLALGVLSSSLSAQKTLKPTEEISDLVGQPADRAALDAVKGDEPQVIRDQIRMCEIPDPRFHEAARA